jgi:hypothetical protein
MGSTYAIDDGTGNQITTGLSEHDVNRVAQSIATRRGETVYVYTLDGTTDSRGDWHPTEEWGVRPGGGSNP